MDHQYYLSRAIELAKKGAGSVSPNPLVGCVIVKDGQIIGEGYHEQYGSNHAEINALQSCTTNPEGATLYVTLEPCSHFGKTPPCTDAIIKHKIGTVVASLRDPNVKVNGSGFEKLRAAGITVIEGLLEPEARELNKFFIKTITQLIPYVTLKVAQSLDGKIGIIGTSAVEITGIAARTEVHKMRSVYDAVFTGINTILSDNPFLTVRNCSGRNPYRLIADSNLRMPINAHVVELATDGKTYVFCTEEAAESQKANSLNARGVKILPVLPNADGKINLQTFLKLLPNLGIVSVYTECGSVLNTALLQQAIPDEIHLYIAPKFLAQGISAFNLPMPLADSQYRAVKSVSFNNDFLLIYKKDN